MIFELMLVGLLALGCDSASYAYNPVPSLVTNTLDASATGYSLYYRTPPGTTWTLLVSAPCAWIDTTLTGAVVGSYDTLLECESLNIPYEHTCEKYCQLAELGEPILRHTTALNATPVDNLVEWCATAWNVAGESACSNIVETCTSPWMEIGE